MNLKEEIELLKKTIETNRTAFNEVHASMHDLNESYRKDQKDQWKLISELNKKVEKLELFRERILHEKEAQRKTERQNKKFADIEEERLNGLDTEVDY